MLFIPDIDRCNSVNPFKPFKYEYNGNLKYDQEIHFSSLEKNIFDHEICKNIIADETVDLDQFQNHVLCSRPRLA